MGPSQPSLQTQENDSPATTQVPPFSHGFGRQLEFLAEGDKRGKNVFSVFFWAQTSEAYQWNQQSQTLKSHGTSADLAFLFFFFKWVFIFVLWNLHSSTQSRTVSAIRDFRQISVSTPRRGRWGRREMGKAGALTAWGEKKKKLCGPCGSDSCNYYLRQDKALPQSNLLCVDVKH